VRAGGMTSLWFVFALIMVAFAAVVAIWLERDR
jgi:hypothetical protein